MTDTHKITDKKSVPPSLVLCFEFGYSRDYGYVCETRVADCELREGGLIGEIEIASMVREVVESYGNFDDAEGVLKSCEAVVCNWWDSDENGGARLWGAEVLGEGARMWLRHALFVELERQRDG